MITKIISSGQGGIEKAALELAIKMEIPYGGWTTESNTKESTRKMSLSLIKSKDNTECIENNIEMSDGILALFRKKTPGSLFNLLKKITKRLNKPFLLMNLNKISKFECALNINKWITEENIRTLYISGEYISEDSSTYQDVMDILESTLYLGQVEQSTPLTANFAKMPSDLPKTVEQAVESLSSKLPLKDKVLIANMTFGELAIVNVTLGKYIRENFGIWTGNVELLESCRKYSGQKDLTVENISMIVIQAFWEKLKETHRLRVIK